MEEEQTTQWPKGKVQKDKQRSTKQTQNRGGSRISSWGGGAHKKNAPSGGRRENVWGISCE